VFALGIDQLLANFLFKNLRGVPLHNLYLSKFSRNSFQRLCSASPVSQFKRVAVIHSRAPATEATGSEEHDGKQ
jgi:hypothetical protein